MFLAIFFDPVYRFSSFKNPLRQLSNVFSTYIQIAYPFETTSA
jgi:hypothetical protein